MKFLTLLGLLPIVSSFTPSTNRRIKIISQRITMFSVPRVKAGLNENPDNTFLLDVREIDEWNQGHLSLANHSPLSQLSSGPVDCCTGKIISTDADIFIHCKLGGRAKKAAALLTEMGYNNVIPLSETFDDLVQAGICEVVKESD
jgi:rhodanese-related sulfurtransferase